MNLLQIFFVDLLAMNFRFTRQSTMCEYDLFAGIYSLSAAAFYMHVFHFEYQCSLCKMVLVD